MIRAAWGTVVAVALTLGPAPLLVQADPGAPAVTPIADPCTSLANLVSRPTFSTAACAVKAGDLLVESGYTNTSTGGTGAGSAVLYPQASLRVGLGHGLEFDLDPASISRLSGAPAIVGETDTSLGVKYEFGYTAKLLYGVNAVYTTNSGSPATSGNGEGVLANINASLTLSPAIGLFATLGYNAQSAGTATIAARYHGIDPSLGASVSLPNSFNAAVEGFGQSSPGPGLGGRYGADAALERDVGSRLQVDVNYYQFFGAPNGAHLHAIGFGAAYLL